MRWVTNGKITRQSENVSISIPNDRILDSVLTNSDAWFLTIWNWVCVMMDSSENKTVKFVTNLLKVYFIMRIVVVICALNSVARWQRPWQHDHGMYGKHIFVWCDFSAVLPHFRTVRNRIDYILDAICANQFQMHHVVYRLFSLPLASLSLIIWFQIISTKNGSITFLNVIAAMAKGRPTNVIHLCKSNNKTNVSCARKRKKTTTRRLEVYF